MSRLTILACAMACAALPAFAPPALAQGQRAAPTTPQSIGKFESWQAWSLTEGGKKLCYAVGRPRDSEPKNVKRDEIYLTVTHRPADKVRGEVGIYVGYPLKKDAPVEASVGREKFSLFAHEESAWVADPAQERKLVESMAKGDALVVKGISQRGTATTDTYALAGLTAALKALDGACK
jgi:hypothetical protein